MSDATAEVFDPRVLDRFAEALGDRSAVRAAVDGWLAALPARLEAIRAAATNGDDVRFPAQRLESASAALGLVAVAAASRSIAEAATKVPGELLERLDEAQAATRRAIGPWQ